MAVVLDQKWRGIELPDAYVRIVAGSIRGGKRGWRCLMESYPNADLARGELVPVRAEDLGPPLRVDENGRERSEEELKALAADLPPKVKREPPYQKFEFPRGTPDRPEIVNYVEGEDPHRTIYEAFMRAHPQAKAV